MSERPSNRIERFSFVERVVHWTVALGFIYLALSGLSLWSPGLFWLSTVLGGGGAVRWGHPWAGLLFAVALGVMFLRWAGAMRLDADDRVWLRGSHRYALHDRSGLPEPGRFNAGQKALFWTQLLATLLLLGSGLVIWFPGVAPRNLTYVALLIHPVVAVVSIGGIIVHIYMAMAVVPGSLRAMLHGWVSAEWAAAHHPKWYRQISRR